MGSLQVGIRLHDLEPVNIEERIKLASERGFSCIHLASKLIYSEFKIGREGLTPGLAAYLKRILDKYGVDVAVYGCYLNLANPDEEQLYEIMEEYRANIRFASYLGAHIVGTETGAPNTEYKTCPECHTEKALDTFIYNVNKVVRYAEQSGVTLAIEPVWKHIVYNPECARMVLDAVDSPNLQLIFDPVNILCEENHTEQGELFEKMLLLNGDDIAVLHAKDYYVQDGKIISVAPGETKNMSYGAILSWQKAKKPFLQATIEDSTPQNSVRARKYLETF